MNEICYIVDFKEVVGYKRLKKSNIRFEDPTTSLILLFKLYRNSDFVKNDN
jgi:hypothetical protein